VNTVSPERQFVPTSTARTEPLLSWTQKSYATALRVTAAAVVPSDNMMIATVVTTRFENRIVISNTSLPTARFAVGRECPSGVITRTGASWS
jgi:hypothetical protein